MVMKNKGAKGTIVIIGFDEGGGIGQALMPAVFVTDKFKPGHKFRQGIVLEDHEIAAIKEILNTVLEEVGVPERL